MTVRVDRRSFRHRLFGERLQAIAITAQRALLGVGLLRTSRALLRGLRRSKPDAQGWTAHVDPGLHPFDTAFGVETAGFIGWRDLQSGGPNDPYISGYLGVTPSVCRRMIDIIGNPAEYTFVDYGCGMGRAAIIASERPFYRVIGLEIVASLAEIARRNVAVVTRNFPDRPSIEIVVGDAVDFELPPGPLVLFFFQPFERPVLRAVLDRLEQSLAAAPRPVILLYLNPLVSKLLDDRSFLERLGEWSHEPTAEERPFSLGGHGEVERFIAWGSRGSGAAIGLVGP